MSFCLYLVSLTKRWCVIGFACTRAPKCMTRPLMHLLRMRRKQSLCNRNTFKNAQSLWRCLQNEDGFENTLGTTNSYSLCFAWRIRLFWRYLSSLPHLHLDVPITTNEAGRILDCILIGCKSWRIFVIFRQRCQHSLPYLRRQYLLYNFDLSKF